MMRNRPWILFAAVILSVVAALVLRDVIHQMIIVPAAYLWWLIGLYYHLVPQVFLWIALIVLVLFSAVRTLLAEIPLSRRTIKVERTPQGPVESLSNLLEKRKRGTYYKWLIANRLGRLARELLDQREGQRLTRGFSRFTGRHWSPPNEVEAYLESGLNGSFADYPRPRWSRRQTTPLDQHPQQVVEFLESEMENRRTGNR
jgi:energy-coupling factor transporter transmembrane protein EcfT